MTGDTERSAQAAWKDWAFGAGATLVLAGIPLLGCVLAVKYNSAWPLLLLLPLFALMEAGIFLIAIALFTVAVINGW